MSGRDHRDHAVRRSLHAAALVFTAWWLIATSAPLEPARDCYTGIGATARLRVTLGAAVAVPDGGIPDVSCAGLDGLAPGSVLTFDLTHGARPEATSDACYGYDTTAISGATDVTVDAPADGVGGLQHFATATGTFESSTRISCRGWWGVWLGPESSPPRGALISPLDAGAAQRWTLRRSMQIAQAQFCDGVFATAGAAGCVDTFVVESIAKEPAP